MILGGWHLGGGGVAWGWGPGLGEGRAPPPPRAEMQHIRKELQKCTTLAH